MTEAASASVASLTIGKVLDELRLEFPDITITKIRYLEEEGLIKPARTSAGYRKFSYADVERLRYILAGQRDNFWPLKYIRQLLDDLDNGIVPDTVNANVRVPSMDVRSNGLPAAEDFAPRTSTIRLSRDELIEATGISAELLDEAEEFGLIDRRERQKFYDAKALAMAALVTRFADLGVGPRHLRSIRITAEREADLIAKVGKTKRHASQSKETMQDMAALLVEFHATVIKNALS